MALNPTDIQKAYVAFFNRPADVAGLTYWSTYAGNSSDLLNTFAKSAEYNALYSGLNNTQLVNAIYQNLFGRSPEPTGLTYWVKELDTGKVTIGNAANTIQTAAQGSDKTTIDNKVAAATAFTTALDTTAEIVGYAGASSSTLGQVKQWLSSVTDSAASLTAAQASLTALTATISGGTNEAGTNYVLTTAQDILTGSNGNDNFRAVAGNTVGTQDQSTLNSSDIIDGGTGSDTLIVNLVGGNYNGGARIKNIETLQIGTNDAAVRTFDYNVNAGANEVTEVTKVVYDQINAGESLSVVNLLKTGNAIPTLSWTNEANSLAGTVSADFRQSAVEGSSTTATIELNNVLADTNVATTGRLNIGAGVETLNIVSGGTSGRNTLNASQRTDGSAVDIVSAGFSTNATTVTPGEGGNDDGSLKTVVVTGSQAFGKAATVVTDTTNASFGLTNRAVAGDLGLDNLQPSASNLVSLAATVTTLDAAEATGDTNIRFTSRVDAAEVNVTYKGGKANDYVEFQQGNINATGGDGNDTFAFVNTQNNSTLTTADTIVGGAGTDTIQMGVNGAGTYNLDTTEFNNKTGIDVLDLRGQTNTVRLADAFVGAADAGLTVRTDKIVQTSDTSTANSTTATTNNGLENNSTNTITLTALSANRAVEFIGGSGSDRIVVNEVSLNSNVKLDGGTNTTTTGRFDTITVQDSAVLSRGDLANVKNFEGIVLVKSDGTSARQYTIEVTETFLTNNSGQNKTLQIGTIAAANQNPLTNLDTVTIDVSDLLTTSNALKTAGYDRKIDTTSLTAAGVTVQYVANGGAVMGATLQTLGVLASTADASQSLVLASAASAVSNAGASGIALNNTAAVITANATALTGSSSPADTLTVTTAGTVTVGSQTTALENLILSSAGANTVTFAQAGFTNITGGSAADDVNIDNLAASTSVSLGAGNDTLRASGALTGTLAGGDGVSDVLTGTATAPTNISGATVSGFEILDFGNSATTFTMTRNQFSGFTSFANFTAGVAAADGITFSDAGAATLNTVVTTYNLANGTNTVDATATATYLLTGGTGADTFNFGAALTAADTVAGGTGTDVLTVTGAATGSTNITAIETIQVNYATAATFTTGAIAPGVASTITAAGSTAAVTLDATAYVATTSLTITDGQGNDVITVNPVEAQLALTTVSLATGGADRIVINDLVHAGTDANGLTVNNFTTGVGAGADQLDIQLDDTAAGQNYLGDYTIVTAAAQVATVLNSTNLTVFEVNQAAAATTSLTDVTDGGAVETALATAFGTITKAGAQQALVILYGTGAANGNAGVYSVDFTNGADAAAGNMTVELIGVVNGVAADSFVSSNIA